MVMDNTFTGKEEGGREGGEAHDCKVMASAEGSSVKPPKN
jgi:hypothetical protein